MAKIHVLEIDNQGNARGVIHTPTPIGNNTVGISWKDALHNCGRFGTTTLVEGTEPGQITTAEKAQVIAGDVMEISVTVNLASIQLTPQAISDYADVIIVEETAKWKALLKYFGYTLA